eukprot:SM000270S10366  [mRNA]  locus=s270:136584:140629:+ [translate_table: standard]
MTARTTIRVGLIDLRSSSQAADKPDQLQADGDGITSEEVPTFVCSIVFPPSVTARQRAAFHAALTFLLMPTPAGCCRGGQGARPAAWEQDRQPGTTITRPSAKGRYVVVPMEEAGLSDACLGELTESLLGLKLDGKLQLCRGTAAMGLRREQDPGSSGREQSADVLTVESFVRSMDTLLDLEKVLLDLRKCPSPASDPMRLPHDSMTLLTFKPNQGDILFPPHKFWRPRDIVALKRSDAEPTSPVLEQGIVYDLREDSITVVVDDIPEKDLDHPIRLETLVNDAAIQVLKDTLMKLTEDVLQGPAADLVPTLFGTRPPTFSGEVSRGRKVLACAASSIAVDNLIERLAMQKLKLVRLGHPARLLPQVLDCSLDAQVLRSDNSALANDAREEMKKLRWLAKEERHRQQPLCAAIIRNSKVILTTLTGALSRHLHEVTFDVIIIDEAAQALEAASWIALLKGRRCVLAGDHLQLPPTVLSKEAERLGLGVTLFERLSDLYGDAVTSLLDVQYRMHEDIMRWSSEALYNGKVSAHSLVAGHKLLGLDGVSRTATSEATLVIVDTTGCDMEEAREEEGYSMLNDGEAHVAMAYAETLLKALQQPTLAS